MLSFQRNKSKYFDILIKNSDMEFELKYSIAQVLSRSIHKYKGCQQFGYNVSKATTQWLEREYDGPWVCILGKNLTCNIMHEPGYFMRASNSQYHIIVYQLKKFDKIKSNLEYYPKRKFIPAPSESTHEHSSYEIYYTKQERKILQRSNLL